MTRPASGNIGEDNSSVSLEEKMLKWEVTGTGQHPLGSNYVFVARLQPTPCSDEEIYCIYKPAAGERPLFDFTYGTLHNREQAAFALSRYLGWPNIPVTIVRDGPYGVGSFQQFIEHDPADNFFSLREKGLEPFAPIMAFDVLTNNADRKGGAVLMNQARKFWAIDHGLTFNYGTRIRTVMIEFSGSEYTSEAKEGILRLLEDLSAKRDISDELSETLGREAVDMLAKRADTMIKEGFCPVLDPNKNLPYPFI